MAELEKKISRKKILGFLGSLAGLYALREIPVYAQTPRKNTAPWLKLSVEASLTGAIVWNGWFAQSEFCQFIKDPAWHDRVPFFATEDEDGNVLEVNGQLPEVTEREIDYATQAGLDFFAFVYYKRFSDHEVYNQGLVNYLNS